MQINISLPDELALELKKLPNADDFIANLLQAALQGRKLEKEPSLTIAKNTESFWQPQPLDYYLKNKSPTKELADFKADFWLEHESVDDLVNFVHKQRQQDIEQTS